MLKKLIQPNTNSKMESHPKSATAAENNLQKTHPISIYHIKMVNRSKTYSSEQNVKSFRGAPVKSHRRVRSGLSKTFFSV